MEFKIYSDGGCLGNKRNAGCRGAYGGVILDPAENIVLKYSGEDINTTNNRMEMMAVIAGLRRLKELTDLTSCGSKIHDCIVISDSRYVVGNYDDYVEEWKKKWMEKKY